MINRFGLVMLLRPVAGARYRESGRFFASYYRWICARCGWSFCKPRHLTHRRVDCDQILVERKKDSIVNDYCVSRLKEINL